MIKRFVIILKGDNAGINVLEICMQMIIICGTVQLKQMLKALESKKKNKEKVALYVVRMLTTDKVAAVDDLTEEMLRYSYIVLQID